MANKPGGGPADIVPLKRYAKVALSPKRNAAHAGMSRTPMQSVRKAEHAGHTIEIRTRYDITIDGRKVTLHMSVGDDGKVICHALPNYLFASAVDLVKTIIDTYPEDFTKRPVRSGPGKAARAGRGSRS